MAVRRVANDEKTMAGYRLLAACGVAVLALHATGSRAQNRSCPPDIPDKDVRHDLDIAGACELDGVEIDGNVTVFAGGSLTARDVRIKGDLEAHRADFVDLERSRVDGTVRLEELVGDLTSLEHTEVRNDVLLARNRSRLEIVNNDIRGDLQALGNTGGVMISGNSVDGNLDCSGNTPAPYGIGNRVDDDAVGQCENLPAGPATSAPPAPPPPPPTTTTTTSSSPPPATTPPATAASETTPPTDTAALEDEGGAGALGWPAAALLLPLLAWRRRKPRAA